MKNLAEGEGQIAAVAGALQYLTEADRSTDHSRLAYVVGPRELVQHKPTLQKIGFLAGLRVAFRPRKVIHKWISEIWNDQERGHGFRLLKPVGGSLSCLHAKGQPLYHLFGMQVIGFLTVLSSITFVFGVAFPHVPQRYQTVVYVLFVTFARVVPATRWLERRFSKVPPTDASSSPKSSISRRDFCFIALLLSSGAVMLSWAYRYGPAAQRSKRLALASAHASQLEPVL